LRKLELAKERIKAAEVCLQDLGDPDTAVFLVKDAIMLAADAVVMGERKLPRRFGKLVGLLSRRLGGGEELRRLFREGRRFQSFWDAAGRAGTRDRWLRGRRWTTCETTWSGPVR